MNPSEMSRLFDVDYDTNLNEVDEASNGRDLNGDALQSFEDRCGDIRSIMESEPESDSKPEPESPQSSTTTESVDVSKEPEKPESVDFDVEDLDVVQKTENKPKPEPPPKAKPEPTAKTEPNEVISDEPVGLEGRCLQAYKDLKSKYPHLKLWSDIKGFRGFYMAKIEVLAEFLSQYRFIPISDMNSELQHVNVEHFVGHDYATPDLLRQKLDDSYYQRTRILDILGEAHSQLPILQRCVELLQGKLYLDHEVKPAHRKEGLNAVHMSDIELYLGGLKGLVKHGEHVDNLLKAAAESLSRQLSCLQLKEPTGFSAKFDKQKQHESKNDNTLDEYDVVDEGQVIGAPKPKEVNVVEFGSAEHDEFSQLGI